MNYSKELPQSIVIGAYFHPQDNNYVCQIKEIVGDEVITEAGYRHKIQDIEYTFTASMAVGYRTEEEVRGKAGSNIQWHDVTSWAAKQRSGGKPVTWRVKTKSVHITVKLVNDEYFTCFCPEAGIYHAALRGSYTIEHAQASAIIMVKEKLQKMLDELAQLGDG